MHLKNSFGVVLFLAVTVNTVFADVAKQAAIKFSDVESSQTEVTLDFRVASISNGCTWGDLDAINSELKVSSKPKLIMSIEPLADSASSAVAYDISKIDLEKGFLATAKLKRSDKAQHLAFYICKDSDGTGRCSGKPLVAPQQVLNQYLVPMDPQTGELKGKVSDVKDPKDKVYYFAYIVVNKNQVGVLKNMMRDTDYEELGKTMSEMGISAAVLKPVKEKSDIMDSVQPVIKDKKISLLLPKLDKSQCPK